VLERVTFMESVRLEW